MKVIILCGGLGSRLSEETKKIPKPMIKIAGKPILVHIMEIYIKNGFDDFILAAGYKYKVIKKYFKHSTKFKKVKVINTGKKTLTGKRFFMLKKYLKDTENFHLTYGDGLTSQNLKRLYHFHIKNKKIGTVTAVRPPVRFGELNINLNSVRNFQEKPQATKGWINGGFFVFNKKIFNILSKKNVMLEREPMNKLVRMKQLNAFKHKGFWQCMDTMRDKIFLLQLIKKNSAPWMK